MSVLLPKLLNIQYLSKSEIKYHHPNKVSHDAVYLQYLLYKFGSRKCVVIIYIETWRTTGNFSIQNFKLHQNLILKLICPIIMPIFSMSFFPYSYACSRRSNRGYFDILRFSSLKLICCTGCIAPHCEEVQLVAALCKAIDMPAFSAGNALQGNCPSNQKYLLTLRFLKVVYVVIVV